MKPSPTQIVRGRLGIAVFLFAFVVAVFPASSYSFQIEGRVVNGTTDSPIGDVKVTVVNPSGGMLVEKEVTPDGEGRFTVDGLDASAPVYLLRVTYKGINYTEMIQPEGQDPLKTEMKVYEPTTSWDHVHVSVPHFIVTRSQDTLSVNKFYDITNHSSPAKTLTAPFAFYVPEDRLVLPSLTVMSLGIPLSRTPDPTDEPGFYTVSHPLKPGGTQISVSMDVPYENDTYTYTEPLKYDLDELVILVNDPTLQITRDGEPVARTEELQGFSGFRLADLKRGETLSLTFAGGSPTPEAGHTVLIVPNQAHRMSIALMVVLGLALLGLLAFATGKQRSHKIQKEVLLVHQNNLLDQLARLDDLHKTGTLSEKIYTIKRTELMDDLAQVYYRTKFNGGPPVKKKKTQKGAARV